MSIFSQFNPSKYPKYRVELHIHLDGSVRLTTLWEIAKKNNFRLEAKTLAELEKICVKKRPSTLYNYLEANRLVWAVFCDDLEALERIAYEFCEDSAEDCVLYTEVRYYPHLFCSTFCKTINDKVQLNPLSGKTPATPKSVVESINKGLARGEKDFDIKIRSILCCLRNHSDWSLEVLNLCKEFKDKGVVGIDIAGVETEGVGTSKDIEVFQNAAKYGIHRTAHAGEAGQAKNVKSAIDDLKVERIGHGYHVLDDESIYEECLQRNTHFEICPNSSYLTGSTPLSCLKHLVVRLAEDNANFSISRDDILVTSTVFDDEYSLLRKMGLTEIHLVRATFNAVRSCFLPENEKKVLFQQLQKIYGIF